MIIQSLYKEKRVGSEERKDKLGLYIYPSVPCTHRTYVCFPGLYILASLLRPRRKTSPSVWPASIQTCRSRPRSRAMPRRKGRKRRSSPPAFPRSQVSTISKPLPAVSRSSSQNPKPPREPGLDDSVAIVGIGSCCTSFSVVVRLP